jgi:hypothetical protein
MAVTYYVALPFVNTDKGVAPGEAQEMLTNRPLSGGPSRCRGIRQKPLAFKRTATRTCQISKTPQF